ncbi:MAG: hypothetical protein ACKOKF_06480 [Bacteroidota bacterium]
MRRCFLFLIVIFHAFLAAAEDFDFKAVAGSWKDTVVYSLHQKPTYFFNLAGYNSFINGEYVAFGGFRMGLDYNERVKFGIGFFLLDPNQVTSSIAVVEDTLTERTNGFLQARYFSLSAEYVIYDRQPWQFSILPVELCIGGAHYRYVSPFTKNRLETRDVPLLFYQPAVTAQYSLLSWLGVGASLGYRMTIFSSPEAREDFSAIGFSAGVRVFVEEAYHAVFPGGIHWERKITKQ